MLRAAILALAATACAAGEPRVAPSPARLEIVDVDSAVFANARALRVWLPPGYDDDPSRTYPVLYMNDGQTLFDAATANLNPAEWRMDETADALIRAGEMEPAVIVGVDNPGKSERPNEYLPWEDVYLSPPVPQPRGADYPAFLFDEVVPFVERRYRVGAAPADRVLGGASYGGLIALYAVIARPGELGGLLIESPSFYVDDAHVLRLAEDADTWPSRVHIGVGTHEGPSECRADNAVAEAVDDVRRLEAVLAARAPDTAVEVVVEDCGLHHEDYWAGRLPAALRFLFPPKA